LGALTKLVRIAESQTQERKQPDEFTTQGNGTMYHAEDRSEDPRERPQQAQIRHTPAEADRPKQE
jgi:hypothetical protein